MFLGCYGAGVVYHARDRVHLHKSMLQYVAVCDNVSQCVAECCSYRIGRWYGVTTISRLLKIKGLFCRISSLL